MSQKDNNPLALTTAANNEADLTGLLSSIDFDLDLLADVNVNLNVNANFRSRSNTWPLKVPDAAACNSRFQPSHQLSASIDEREELTDTETETETAVDMPGTFDCDPVSMAAELYQVGPCFSPNAFATSSRDNGSLLLEPAPFVESPLDSCDDQNALPVGNNNRCGTLNRNAAQQSCIPDGLQSSGTRQVSVLGHSASPRSDSPSSSTQMAESAEQFSQTCKDASHHKAQNDLLESLLSDERIAALLSTNLSGTRHKPTRRNAWGNLSYADLITLAIESSPGKRLTLTRIYEWMMQNVPYFMSKADQNSSAGWKNSIRHNLSLHSRFMRIQNETTGKSSWWVINPDVKNKLLAQHQLSCKQDNDRPLVTASHRRRAATMDVGEAAVKRNKLKRSVDARRGRPSHNSSFKQPPPPLQSAGGSFCSLASLCEQQQDDPVANNSNGCGLPAAVAALQIDAPQPPFYAPHNSGSPSNQHSQHTSSGSPSAYVNPMGSQFAADMNPDLFDSPFACEADCNAFGNTKSAYPPQAATYYPQFQSSQFTSAGPLHTQAYRTDDYFNSSAMFTQSVVANAKPSPTPQAAFNDALSAQRNVSMASCSAEVRAAQQAVLTSRRDSPQACGTRMFGELLEQTNGVNSPSELLHSPPSSMLRAALLAPPRFNAASCESTNPALRGFLSQEVPLDQQLDCLQPNATAAGNFRTAAQPLAEFYWHGDQQGAFFDSADGGTVFTTSDGSPANFTAYANQTACYNNNQSSAVYPGQLASGVHATQRSVSDYQNDSPFWSISGVQRQTSVAHSATYFGNSPDYPGSFALQSFGPGVMKPFGAVQPLNDMTVDASFVNI